MAERGERGAPKSSEDAVQHAVHLAYSLPVDFPGQSLQQSIKLIAAAIGEAEARGRRSAQQDAVMIVAEESYLPKRDDGGQWGDDAVDLVAETRNRINARILPERCMTKAEQDAFYRALLGSTELKHRGVRAPAPPRDGAGAEE